MMNTAIVLKTLFKMFYKMTPYLHILINGRLKYKICQYSISFGKYIKKFDCSERENAVKEIQLAIIQH